MALIHFNIVMSMSFLCKHQALQQLSHFQMEPRVVSSIFLLSAGNCCKASWEMKEALRNGYIKINKQLQYLLYQALIAIYWSYHVTKYFPFFSMLHSPMQIFYVLFKLNLANFLARFYISGLLCHFTSGRDKRRLSCFYSHPSSFLLYHHYQGQSDKM